MDLLSLLLNIVTGCCTFYAGYKYREARYLHDLMTNIKSIESQFGSALGDDVTLKVLTIQDLKCEIVGDRFYFYATEDDTFISHGTSLEEAAESYGKATNNDFVARFTDPTSNTLQYIVNGRITSSVYSPDSHSITNVGEPGA